MSILSRIKAVFESRANQIVDGFEDPKASLDYSLEKLEENRTLIGRSLIEVSAAKNRLQAQRSQVGAAIDKYEEQAQSAIKANREDLARLALERKQDALARQAELEKNLASLNTQEENLKQSELSLTNKIALFNAKKEELKAMYDSSRAQLQMREAMSGISADLADVGNTIQRAEARIREMQSRSDAIEKLISEGVFTDVLEPGVDEVDRELSKLHRKQAVEDELARLKAAQVKE
jgi:phage shock protein A